MITIWLFKELGLGLTNSNDSKKSGKIPKICTKCLKYNKEEADIPESVMKTHDATNCYVQPTKYNESGASSSSSLSSSLSSSSNASNTAFNKFSKAVNQISTHLDLSSKAKVKVNETSITDSFVLHQRYSYHQYIVTYAVRLITFDLFPLVISLTNSQS